MSLGLDLAPSSMYAHLDAESSRSACKGDGQWPKSPCCDRAASGDADTVSENLLPLGLYRCVGDLVEYAPHHLVAHRGYSWKRRPTLPGQGRCPPMTRVALGKGTSPPV